MVLHYQGKCMNISNRRVVELLKSSYASKSFTVNWRATDKTLHDANVMSKVLFGISKNMGTQVDITCAFQLCKISTTYLRSNVKIELVKMNSETKISFL